MRGKAAMPDHAGAKPPLPSLLDRLIDDEPQRGVDAATASKDGLARIRGSLRRDLENLLNTRAFPVRDLAPYPELPKSLAAYGLPDLSTVLVSDPTQRELFRHSVQTTIRRFEPRLRNTRVTLEDIDPERERTLCLKISAVLLVEPSPVAVLFDTRLHGADRHLTLRELHHG